MMKCMYHKICHLNYVCVHSEAGLSAAHSSFNLAKLRLHPC